MQRCASFIENPTSQVNRVVWAMFLGSGFRQCEAIVGKESAVGCEHCSACSYSCSALEAIRRRLHIPFSMFMCLNVCNTHLTHDSFLVCRFIICSHGWVYAEAVGDRGKPTDVPAIGHN